MVQIRFRLLPPVGPIRGPWRQASLPDVLLRIPAFPLRGIIPSFEPMGDLLEVGRSEGGMSGGVQWEPFHITKPQYASLVLDLCRRRPALQTLAAPGWVRTMEDWLLYLDEKLDGIPARLQRPYVRRIRVARAKLFAAMERGDDAAIAQLTREEVLLQVDHHAARERFRASL